MVNREQKGGALNGRGSRRRVEKGTAPGLETDRVTKKNLIGGREMTFT